MAEQTKRELLEEVWIPQEGECEYLKYGALEMLSKRCVDIFQPDTGACGGITEVKKMMAIANACEEMIQSGHFEENVLGHSYHMQSGTYFLIIAVAKTFGISAFTS